MSSSPTSLRVSSTRAWWGRVLFLTFCPHGLPGDWHTGNVNTYLEVMKSKSRRRELGRQAAARADALGARVGRAPPLSRGSGPPQGERAGPPSHRCGCGRRAALPQGSSRVSARLRSPSPRATPGVWAGSDGGKEESTKSYYH